MLIQISPHGDVSETKWNENRSNPSITSIEGDICITQGDWQVEHLAALTNPIGEICIKKLRFLFITTPCQNNPELIGMSLDQRFFS